MRLWPLCVDHLRGNEFCGGFDEGGLLPGVSASRSVPANSRAARHVAVDALRADAARLVVMVLGRVEFRGHVALGAQRIAAGAQLRAVRVVAIGAGDSWRETCGSAGTSRIRRPRHRFARRRDRGPPRAAPEGRSRGAVPLVSDSWRSLCGGNDKRHRSRARSRPPPFPPPRAAASGGGSQSSSPNGHDRSASAN